GSHAMPIARPAPVSRGKGSRLGIRSGAGPGPGLAFALALVATVPVVTRGQVVLPNPATAPLPVPTPGPDPFAHFDLPDTWEAQFWSEPGVRELLALDPK